MARAHKPGGNAGKGRPKGKPNKITADLKAMILGALDEAGGQTYLAEQATKSPAAFLTLVGKVLPLQIAGHDGGAIKYQSIDAPAKETREEWLARTMGTAAGAAAGGDTGDVV